MFSWGWLMEGQLEVRQGKGCFLGTGALLRSAPGCRNVRSTPACVPHCLRTRPVGLRGEPRRRHGAIPPLHTHTDPHCSARAPRCRRPGRHTPCRCGRPGAQPPPRAWGGGPTGTWSGTCHLPGRRRGVGKGRGGRQRTGRRHLRCSRPRYRGRCFAQPQTVRPPLPRAVHLLGSARRLSRQDRSNKAMVAPSCTNSAWPRRIVAIQRLRSAVPTHRMRPGARKRPPGARHGHCPSF